MKRLLILLALAIALCAGMASLCTACSADDTTTSQAAFSGKEPDPPQRECVPTATPDSETQEIRKTDTPIDAPDLQGIIQEAGEGTLTIQPIEVESTADGVAAAACYGNETLTVDIQQADIETVRVYDGGYSEPQAADQSALTPKKQVYLYGERTEKGFTAEKVLVLEIEADPS